MRDIRFDDYLTEGIHGIIETARAMSGADKVHAVGYCIGGTGLSMYMAWANKHFPPEQVPVADVTLFTTLVDFHAPGDINVFIDESSVNYLEMIAMEPLSVGTGEPLKLQLLDFLDAVRTNRRPLVNAEDGFAAVRTAERIVAAAKAAA